MDTSKTMPLSEENKCLAEYEEDQFLLRLARERMANGVVDAIPFSTVMRSLNISEADIEEADEPIIE